MMFVWVAGIELDIGQAWKHRRETGITAGLALGTPLLFGAVAALFILRTPGWIGAAGAHWPVVAAIGMAWAGCRPSTLALFMGRLPIPRPPLGPRANTGCADGPEEGGWHVLKSV